MSKNNINVKFESDFIIKYTLDTKRRINMNKKIKRLSLTVALIHLLQNDYCLAKDNSLSNIFNGTK